MSSTKGTIIVTGAAGGIGNGLVTEFLKTSQATLHHSIYMVHPSAPGTLKEVLAARAPANHEHEIITLDLSSFTSIRTFASSINERIASGSLPPIRGLFLVAGGIFNSPSTVDGINYTSDGLEMTFSVNFLANFLLVLSLLESMDKEHGRIIFVSSTTHNPVLRSNAFATRKEEHKILFRDVEILAKGKQEEVEKGDQFGAAMRRYGASKLCMNLFMHVTQFLLSLFIKLIIHI